MRIAVNLASHPYFELRPIYNRLRTWMLILALLGLALWFLYRSERIQAREALAQVNSVQHHVQQLEDQQRSYVTMMQQPKDAAILQQSDFLNGLFRRKAFSWTATMTDLENVLPSGVQVQSIDPIVAPDGHVTIRLRVTGERDRALDLVRNLEKSKHFAQPRLASETLATAPGTQGNNVQAVSTNANVNFDILADYRPLPLPANGREEEDKPQAKELHASLHTPVHMPRRVKPAAAPGDPAQGRRPHP